MGGVPRETDPWDIKGEKFKQLQVSDPGLEHQAINKLANGESIETHG